MEIVIPCAGEGRRFQEQGYDTIKQLLPLNGRPVLHYLVESLRVPDARFTFIFQEKHLQQYGADIESSLQAERISYQLRTVPALTDGAVSTVLHACADLHLDDELLIANSDQWVRWNIQSFLSSARGCQATGAMPLFIDMEWNAKWSFVSLTEDSYITEVRAKDPFTSFAVVGIYYFKTGHDYVTYANQMVSANKRVNNEFYVCPVFNEVVAAGHRVFGDFVELMVGLGTPEDYERARHFFEQPERNHYV